MPTRGPANATPSAPLPLPPPPATAEGPAAAFAVALAAADRIFSLPAGTLAALPTTNIYKNGVLVAAVNALAVSGTKVLVAPH